MVNGKEFTKRLEKIMQFYSLTASALADEIDFNRSTISHLISGRNKPSLEFVMKLLQKFPEVNWDWLVLGRGSFPSGTSENEQKKVPPVKSEIPKATTPNLFSEVSEQITAAPKTDIPSQIIDRIVIFYKNGSFKVYEN